MNAVQQNVLLATCTTGYLSDPAGADVQVPGHSGSAGKHMQDLLCVAHEQGPNLSETR